MDNRLIELIAKKKAGGLTLTEQLELRELFRNNEADRQISEQLDWVYDMSMNDTNYVSGDDVENFIATVQASIHRKQEGESHSINWQKIVAVAALFILIAGIFLYIQQKDVLKDHKQNVVSTQKGSRSYIELPDGTKVWINADTRITYDKSFGKESRAVTLAGEAYFDVTHDARNPFIVHTASMDIKVLGTAFNVKAYPNDVMAQATLLRGSIEVQLNSGKRLLLAPNEKLIIRSGQEEKKSIAPGDAVLGRELEVINISGNDSGTKSAETGWVTNELVFNKNTIQEMIPVLERWYNVNIEFTGSSTNTFTGSFNNQTLDDVLQSLKALAGLDYKKENDKIIIY